MHSPLSKTGTHYQTVIDQTLTVLHQLFSWTLDGPSKRPIDKMIGSQVHRTFCAIPREPYVLAKKSIIEFFSEINIFSNYALSFK